MVEVLLLLLLLDFLPAGRPAEATRALAVDAADQPDGERMLLPITEFSMVVRVLQQTCSCSFCHSKQADYGVTCHRTG